MDAARTAVLNKCRVFDSFQGKPAAMKRVSNTLLLALSFYPEKIDEGISAQISSYHLLSYFLET